MKTGAVDFLAKPFRDQDMLDAVTAALAKDRIRRESEAGFQGRNGQALSSPFATTIPGIFAVGDVRSGSVKRVASGVGEGSVVVQATHRFLQCATP